MKIIVFFLIFFTAIHLSAQPKYGLQELTVAITYKGKNIYCNADEKLHINTISCTGTDTIITPAICSDQHSLGAINISWSIYYFYLPEEVENKIIISAGNDDKMIVYGSGDEFKVSNILSITFKKGEYHISALKKTKHDKKIYKQVENYYTSLNRETEKRLKEENENQSNLNSIIKKQTQKPIPVASQNNTAIINEGEYVLSINSIALSDRNNNQSILKISSDHATIIHLNSPGKNKFFEKNQDHTFSVNTRDCLSYCNFRIIGSSDNEIIIRFTNEDQVYHLRKLRDDESGDFNFDSLMDYRLISDTTGNEYLYFIARSSGNFYFDSTLSYLRSLPFKLVDGKFVQDIYGRYFNKCILLFDFDMKQIKTSCPDPTNPNKIYFDIYEFREETLQLVFRRIDLTKKNSDELKFEIWKYLNDKFILIETGDVN